MFLSTHIRASLLTFSLCLCLFSQHFYLDWILSLHRPVIASLWFDVQLSSGNTVQQYAGPFVAADWESWWTYEGISGPDFWGRLNPKWSHCSKGHRQSPIDIATKYILYDPNLEPVRISGDFVKGQLINTGRGISLAINTDKPVTVTDGPFSYTYTLSNLSLHFGRENSRGSEHTIDEMQFPGELQLYAYNSQLYANWTEAKKEPNGIAAISVFIVLAKSSNQANPALKHITNSLKNITRRGQSYSIEGISVLELLPTLKQYVTYEGSLTQPACHETVQWVILNRPIYISAYQFHMLRHSLKGDGHQDNFRPTQPLNKRPLRANIIAHDHLQGSAGSAEATKASAKPQNGKLLNLNKNMPEFSMMADEPVLSLSEEDQQNIEQLNDLAKKLDSADVSSPSNSWKDPNNSADALEAFSKLTPSTVRDAVCLPDQLRLYGYRANRKVNEDM